MKHRESKTSGGDAKSAEEAVAWDKIARMIDAGSKSSRGVKDTSRMKELIQSYRSGGGAAGITANESGA